MRQHGPPHWKRQKNGHQDHEGHDSAVQDEEPPGNEPVKAGTAAEEQPKGFEVVI